MNRVRASRLFRQGVRCIEREEFEEALACFEELAANDPRDAPAHSNIGYCNFRLGRLPAAAAAYQRAVELSPDDPQYICDLGSVYIKMNRLDEAVAAYSRAAREKSDYLPAYLGMGNAYRRLGGHAEAVAAFKRALTLDPRCVEAQIGLGLSLTGLNQAETALGILERVVTTHADHAAVHEGLADAYESLGRDREALVAREEAARLQPFSAGTQLALGRTCARMGQWKRAFAAFQRALRLQPELAEAKAGLADAHDHLTEEERASLETGGRGKAADESSAAPVAAPAASADVDIEPDHETEAVPPDRPGIEESAAAMPDTDRDMTVGAAVPATSTGEAGREEEEEEAAPVRETVSREAIEDLVKRGESQYLLGHYSEALELWDEAILHDRENTSLYNNRAAALMHLGRIDEAIRACRDALRIDPAYGVARVTLCEIHLSRGDRVAALREIEALRASDPDLAAQAAELLQE